MPTPLMVRCSGSVVLRTRSASLRSRRGIADSSTRVVGEVRVASTGPVPPANVGPEPVITGDQLEEWDSGSLAEYLARRGLMSEASTAAPVERDYDPDGFFLDEGPNNNGRRSRVIIY